MKVREILTCQGLRRSRESLLDSHKTLPIIFLSYRRIQKIDPFTKVRKSRAAEKKKSEDLCVRVAQGADDEASEVLVQN